MFEQLSFPEFKALACRGRRVIVHRSLPMDRLTPIGAYQALHRRGKAYLLESATGDRHSFIGCNPRLCLEARGSEIRLLSNGHVSIFNGDPIDQLRQLHAQYRAAGADALPPMTGGAIGFFSYDAIRYLENLPDRHERERDFPDVSFTFFDAVVGFDHQNSRLMLTYVVEISEDLEESYRRAVQELDSLVEQLNAPMQVQTYGPSFKELEIKPDIDDVTYANLVCQAKEAIVSGELFQVVLSRRFQCAYTVQPLDIYRAMRMINPAPFMFFLDEEDYAVAGASPERMVRLERGRLETAPLAGTRPRGDGSDDAALIADLLQDPKELAEHMMLVDLGRNDLGRISKPGTVAIQGLKEIVCHGPVMHLSTRIISEIDEALGAIEALKATLPAGTVSGAPKIRAMELIDELETSRRGLYGGAVGYLSANGDFDSCIAIRLAHLSQGVATVRTGAGIVFDSVPEKEAAETRHKAEGVLRAIALAEGGPL